SGRPAAPGPSASASLGIEGGAGRASAARSDAQAPPSSSSEVVFASQAAGGVGRPLRVRVPLRGGAPAWGGRLTPPRALAAAAVALLLVFGAFLLLRSPARRADTGAARADESEDTLGRTLGPGGSSPRGSAVQQPQTAAEFYENGTYFLSIRSYDAAIRDLRRAVELQPNFPSAHNRVGRAFMLKGQFAPAAEEVRTAIQQQGGN